MCSVVPAWIYFYLFLALCCSTKVCSGWEPVTPGGTQGVGGKVTNWCHCVSAMTELHNYVHQGSFSFCILLRESHRLGLVYLGHFSGREALVEPRLFLQLSPPPVARCAPCPALIIFLHTR